MQEGRSSDLCWIRCDDGFLSAWKDGSMRVLPHVRSWEWFTITVVAERKVTLLTHHGSYVVAAADGAVTHERLHEVKPRALWRVIKSATSPSEFELSNEIYEEGILSVSYDPREDGPKKVTCRYADDPGPPRLKPRPPACPWGGGPGGKAAGQGGGAIWQLPVFGRGAGGG